jgi:hypothetical protein
MGVNSNRVAVSVHDRSYFGRQWLDRAKIAYADGDVFSSFFSGYIALVGSATQMMADSSKSGRIQKSNDDDAWEWVSIEESFTIRARQIAEFVDSDLGRKITGRLRLREIPGESNSRIISTSGDQQFSKAVDLLNDFWSPVRMMSWDDSSLEVHAKACAYLFRRVRNRLFHGEKLNDPDGSDAELLERLNPLLFEIVEIVLVH